MDEARHSLVISSNFSMHHRCSDSLLRPLSKAPTMQNHMALVGHGITWYLCCIIVVLHERGMWGINFRTLAVGLTARVGGNSSNIMCLEQISLFWLLDVVFWTESGLWSGMDSSLVGSQRGLQPWGVNNILRQFLQDGWSEHALGLQQGVQIL